MTGVIEASDGGREGRWAREISEQAGPGGPCAARRGGEEDAPDEEEDLDDEDEDLENEDLDDDDLLDDEEEDEDEDEEFVDDDDDTDEEDDDPVEPRTGVGADGKGDGAATLQSHTLTHHGKEPDRWPSRPRNACGSRSPRPALTRADS